MMFSWISEVEKELIEVRDNLINRFKEYEARNHERAALLDQAFLDYLSVYRSRLGPLLSDAQMKKRADTTKSIQPQRLNLWALRSSMFEGHTSWQVFNCLGAVRN